MPNYGEFTQKGSNFIKFNEDNLFTIEGIFDGMDDLHDTNFDDPKNPGEKQKAYTYYVLDLETGVRGQFDVGSYKLFNEFVNQNIQEGAHVKIKRKGSGPKTSYEVTVLKKGNGKMQGHAGAVFGEDAATEEAVTAPF